MATSNVTRGCRRQRLDAAHILQSAQATTVAATRRAYEESHKKMTGTFILLVYHPCDGDKFAVSTFTNFKYETRRSRLDLRTHGANAVYA
jgi:hypothetical protein